MYHFYIQHHGEHDRLGLSQMLREYARQQPIPSYMTEEQAAELVMRRYRELIEAELQQIEIRAIRSSDEPPPTGVEPGSPPPPDAPF